MPGLSPDPDDIPERARRLLEPGALPVAAGDDARPLAWALKDLCYQAWSTEPARSERAAQVLRTLADAAPPAQLGEVAALADWCEGIARLTQGRMADAVRAFDAAAAGLRAAGQPDPAAQTQVPKIMALSMLGRHAEAAACAEAAQRELRALGNVAAAGRVSLNLGTLMLRRDDFHAAARHYREASVLFARVGERRQSVVADAGLADAMAGLGDLDEAMRIYDRARMRAVGEGFELTLAQIDESAGLVEMARGRWREALAGFESACRRYAALGLPQYLAIAEKQLGDAYLELHLLPEALRTLEAALARFTEQALPEERAWALAQRGRALALLGRPSEAAAAFAEAAEVFAGQQHAVGAAAVALARAELALAAGEPALAREQADAAALGFDFASQPLRATQARLLRAEALLADGRLDAADAALARVLDDARHLGQRPVQLRARTGQGLVARARGDASRAREAFEDAIAAAEAQRGALPGDDLRRAFLGGQLRPYEERLALALDDGDPADVLVQLERFRARALDDAREPATEPPDDARRAARDRLDWLYRRIQRLQDEGDAATTAVDEARRLEHELLERARRQRLAGAGGAASEVLVDPAQLCAALAPGDALVAYGVAGGALFACLAMADGVTLHRALAPWPAVAEAVRALQFQLDALRHGAAAVSGHLDVLTRRTQARLAALHALVWAPLEGRLGAARRVIVVPHGPLGGVPFAALGDAGGVLLDRHELALAPSARAALRGLRRAPVPVRSVLAVSDPQRLPGAAAEARRVVACHDSGELLEGPQATPDAVAARSAAADLLHLACHAQFRADNPAFSALHLSGGALTVERIEGLAMRAATVVLSACETGVDDASRGDERVGLVRAFLVAGAARVVASLWPVDDAETTGFMADLHAALHDGVGPAAALRAAQHRQRERQPHPAFWGAFTVHGGW